MPDLYEQVFRARQCKTPAIVFPTIPEPAGIRARFWRRVSAAGSRLTRVAEAYLDNLRHEARYTRDENGELRWREEWER